MSYSHYQQYYQNNQYGNYQYDRNYNPNPQYTNQIEQDTGTMYTTPIVGTATTPTNTGTDMPKRYVSKPHTPITNNNTKSSSGRRKGKIK